MIIPVMKSISPSRRLPFMLMALLWQAMVLPLFANPDFSASEITVASETVLEGEIAHFKLLLRNRGDAPADPTQLRIRWPLMGHLVEVSGLDQAQIDHDAGEVTAPVALPPGAERVVEVAVLAPRDSGGRMLSMTAQLMHFHTMTEHWFHGSITIDTRIRSDGVRLGGLRIAPAGVATFAWLIVTAVAVAGASILGTRGRSGFFSPRAGVVAVMIAVGFWMVFAAMAWRDYQILYKWPETTGTIIGRRVESQTVTSSQRPGSGTLSRTRHTDVSKPEFALRYRVDGREMFSTGYDTGSSLRVGGGKAQLEKEFRDWTVGAQVPCWFDPSDPTDVVVKRGFGGAYLFALLPLFPFLIGLSILRRCFLPAE